MKLRRIFQLRSAHSISFTSMLSGWHTMACTQLTDVDCTEFWCDQCNFQLTGFSPGFARGFVLWPPQTSKALQIASIPDNSSFKCHPELGWTSQGVHGHNQQSKTLTMLGKCAAFLYVILETVRSNLTSLASRSNVTYLQFFHQLMAWPVIFLPRHTIPRYNIFVLRHIRFNAQRAFKKLSLHFHSFAAPASNLKERVSIAWGQSQVVFQSTTISFVQGHLNTMNPRANHRFLHLIQWLWWFFCRALEHLRSRVGITPSLSSRSPNPSRCRPLAISRKESRLKARPQEISPGVGCPMIFLWFLCIYVCLWLSVHFLGGTNCP